MASRDDPASTPEEHLSSGDGSVPPPAPDAEAPERDDSMDASGARGGDASATFSVVAIGASAGGLKAYSDFFKALPENTGMAFVLVQHLAPNHQSELAELLQHHTPMRVVQVEDSMKAEADGVYVIPPGKALSIKNDVLHLAEPEQPHGHRAPIDDFFRSLASDQGEQSVCIVLSGAGSDGSIGLKALKEAGGLTLAQDPGDAEYGGMPRSAIGTGFVDVVLPAAELAARLVELRRNGVPIPDDANALSKNDAEALSKIFTQLRAGTGHDFSRYKRSTVLRRIGRRMQVLGVDDLAAYLQTLRRDGAEVDALLKDLLISVTSFFRDPEVFATVEHEVIPQLFEDKGPGDQVRVWVPGCATGEEAYSLAILLCEHASAMKDPPELQVFATDIDERALVLAREGVYPEVTVADIAPERLDKFFEVEGGAYRVKKSIRELVLFASHNLLKDPPFSKLDLISCRNLLIYLQRETQERIFELFAYALRPTGLLLLGTSESAESTKDLFTTVHKKHRVFRSRGVVRNNLRVPILRPLSAPPTRENASPKPRQPVSFEDLHNRLLATHYAPPSVIVGPSYEVLHSAGKVGRFLSFATGEPTNHLLKLTPTDLRPELRTALFQAFEKGQSTERLRVRARLGDASASILLTVRPLTEPEMEGLVQIVFDEEPSVPPTPATPRDTEDRPSTEHLEEVLQRTQERLQSMIEEYETSTEELKASNEEVLSMNEELVTVNHELKTKIEELGRVNADLQNLINSTDVATLFLDRDLRITRYTPRLAELFNILPSDRGRPIAHLTQKISYGGFVDDAREVLNTLVPYEREVEGEDGQCFLTRLVPYRTSEDRIDGVVATFVDITRRMQAEEAAKRREERFRRAIVEAPIPVFLYAEDGDILQLSHTVTEISGYTPDELPTLEAWARLAYGDGSSQVMEDVERLFESDHRVDEGEYTIRTKEGDERVWQFSSAPVGTDGQGRKLVISMAADVTERKRAEAEREERARQQNVVASLGLYALSDPSLDALFERAVHFVQVTLGMDFSKVLELDAEGEHLLLHTGVGWKDGLAGKATVRNSKESQAGFTLLQETPVLVTDFARESRFSSPDLLTTHGVQSGMSVIIGSLDHPFGVLGTHARKPRSFSQADADFLQAVANVLGSAIERAEAHRLVREANEQLESYAQDLEQRAEERTDTLRTSEARLRTLYEVISQPTAALDAQIRRALELATNSLGLDAGIVSRVEGEVYTVEHCYAPDLALEPGQRFAVDDAPCTLTLEAAGPLLIDHLSDSEYRSHPCRDVFEIEAYAGAPVRVGGTLFGTLSFMSAEPKTPPFSDGDRELVALLAQWMGSTIERGVADEQLERSEHLLAGVLLGSLDGIAALEAVRDTTGRIEDFRWMLLNPAASTFYKHPPEDMIGHRYLEAFPAAQALGFFQDLVNVVETGEPYQREVHYDADGMDAWFASSVVKLGDGVAVTFRDITQRKQTEDSLRDSEARFRELFESSPDAIFVEGLDGVVLDVNPAACRLHRADRDWLVGRSVTDLVPPGYRDQAMQDFAHFTTGRSSLLESFSLTKDGIPIPVEVRTDRIVYNGQDALLLHVRDITERHAAQRAIKESEERFAKAFHAAPVAVTISTYSRGRYVDVNDSFCTLTGYTREEVIGYTNDELGLVPLEQLPVLGLEQLRNVGAVREVEFQIRTKQGDLRDVLISAELLELGGVPCVLGIGFDVTERKRLEREVIEAAESERRRIGQDLHDELGQQLTGAAFLGKVLQQKLAAKNLEEAEDATQLTALIGNVLAETRDLSRLLSPVDVQAEGLMDALQDLVDQTERVFDVSCLLDIEGDVRIENNAAASHLYRIAQEAVNNAIKHADPSAITVRLVRSDHTLTLTVSDDGSGFEAGIGQQPPGLGLRTMRYRAALIGATLTVERDTPGSLVTATLPLPEDTVA